MLQAAFLEPVAVMKLHNEISEARKNIEELQLSVGSRVVSRRVNLIGSRSRHLYVYAETLLAADRVPLALLSELHNTEKPLGYLLRDNDHSGRKELLSVDSTLDDPKCPTSSACVNRRYVVVHKQEPIALVSEYFECSKFD
jgi:chorismate-pyruvate lyase